MIKHVCAAGLAAATLTFGLVSPGSAQELTRIEGLGSLSFPNSGAQAAQQDFIRGVLLLHSFEYDYAAAAFKEAQRIDPDFALAYWGEAMTYTHPVWNQKDRDAALEALARYTSTPRARATRAPTERERAYLAAVDVLYGEGQKATLDTLYSREMARLASAYPNDLEAQTFYALSLLGLSQGDRSVDTYVEAGAIALAAFATNADHPGAAHYTIHAFDDPTHAILAMPAARAYSQIAPDAAHAQHMTTHIFLARGMWDDVVEANVRADAVTDRNLAARQLPQTDCGHYNEWLMYGYQQQGKYEAAEALLMGCFAQTGDERLPALMRQRAASSYAYMRSLHLADTRHWNGKPATAELADGDASTILRLMQAWGSGLAAVQRGDRATAQRHYAFLKDHGGSAGTEWEGPYVPVWQGTLEAILLADAGDPEGAIRAAQTAADSEASLPVDFGPPIAFKPARELEGELLLDQNRAEEAVTAFQTQLSRTPNRIASVVGLARAAAKAGRPDLAALTYHTLSDLLSAADEDVPEAREARSFLAARSETSSR